MIIGIIGAENSHAAAIAECINVKKRIQGVHVNYIWGETKEFAEKTAKIGQISNIVSKPSEMLDKVDAVVVDHRDAKYHLTAALPFIKKGLPVFIDKPFCCNAAEGRKFFKKAQNYKAAVTSFGVMPLQKNFIQFLKKIKKIGKIHSGTFYGPCDINSKYGGVFFYGIHQVEMALIAFGYDVEKVCVNVNRKNALCQLIYKDDKIVSLNLINSGCSYFAISAVGDKGTINYNIPFDKDMYLPGIKRFTKMFKEGLEPLSIKEILRPIEILEAMKRSIDKNKTIKV